MRNQFDRQLDQLNNEMIHMGQMIEQAIENAVDALMRKDLEKAAKNMAYDIEVDRQEKEIENLCMKLLLQQQPVAKDLRVISSALKMITDMERIGDQAADISELTLYLSEYNVVLDLADIRKMAQETMWMVVKSIEAYVGKDLDMAEKVIAHDDIVDDLFIKAKRELIELIQQEPLKAPAAADLLMVAKYFERIGDHATNIAEWVIYSINGRHASMSQEGQI